LKAKCDFAHEFSIDLRRPDDITFLFALFDFLKKNIVKANATDLTLKKEGGDLITVNPAGYNVTVIRNSIYEVLKKNPSQEQALFISVNEVPVLDPIKGANPEDSINIATLNMVVGEFWYKGPEGQNYWTIGDGPDNDVILAKTNSVFGTHFIVFYDNGAYYIKDNNTTHPLFDVLVSLPGKDANTAVDV